MKKSPDLTTAERIESLKAGILGALSLILAYSLIAVGNRLVLAEQFEALAVLQITSSVNLLVKMAIAGLSGFLFGVTYRYVIRDDDNPHLKAGVVMAFGLVRGLAVVEMVQNLADTFWALGILSAESILCFAIALLILDWALKQTWIKPLKSG